MDYPVFSLNAVTKNDIAANTKVFNIQDFEYYLWVRVPVEINRVFKFYQLDEFEGKQNINIRDICEHLPGRVWYKFNSHMLNRNPGLHNYCMRMVNREDSTTITLYFGYVVQRSDTDKPYVYMKDGHAR